jgi:hypothetical protein
MMRTYLENMHQLYFCNDCKTVVCSITPEKTPCPICALKATQDARDGELPAGTPSMWKGEFHAAIARADRAEKRAEDAEHDRDALLAAIDYAVRNAPETCDRDGYICLPNDIQIEAYYTIGDPITTRHYSSGDDRGNEYYDGLDFASALIASGVDLRTVGQ